VRRIASRFGVDAGLIAAVEHAEGNILKAIQCSFPNVKTRDDALEITCRSAIHAMSDFIRSDAGDDNVPLKKRFVEFWAHRWAPVGADNDPKGLNANWPKNVLAGWR